MRNVKAQEVQDFIKSGKNVTIIDTLGEESYRQQHLPGAINIPGKSQDFVESVQGRVPDKDATIVTYCSDADCPVSPEAARKLEAAGYTNVLEFEGGLKGWKEAGYGFETAFGAPAVPKRIPAEAEEAGS